MAGEVKLGLNCKAYVDTAGVGVGTWAELAIIGGVTVTQSRKEVAIDERTAEEAYVVGKRVREVSFTLTRRPGNTLHDALETAYEGGGFLGFAFMNGPIATVGSKGYQANMLVTKFDDDQGAEGATISVTLKPAADSTTAPARVTISS